MSTIETKEIAKLKEEIKEDIKNLFESYLNVSSWDVPENDETNSAKLLVAVFKETIDEIEKTL